MENLPNFIKQHHETERNKIREFPGLGINSFIIRELSQKQMNNLLIIFRGYPHYYNKFKELFKTEIKYRKHENSKFSRYS